jgi:uncharacterized protein
MIFADTFYFLAIGNKRDHGHQRAAQYAIGYKGKILTTEWVLTEVADALSAPPQRSRFIGLVELIRRDTKWIVIDSSHDLFELGTELFTNRPDKS